MVGFALAEVIQQYVAVQDYVVRDQRSAEVLGGARLKAKAAQGDETFARSREPLERRA